MNLHTRQLVARKQSSVVFSQITSAKREGETMQSSLENGRKVGFFKMSFVRQKDGNAPLVR